MRVPHCRAARRAGEPDERIQLVHRPVAFDARIVFGNALAACEPRLARVAGFRIDTVQVEGRRVESVFIHKLGAATAL